MTSKSESQAEGSRPNPEPAAGRHPRRCADTAPGSPDGLRARGRAEASLSSAGDFRRIP